MSTSSSTSSSRAYLAVQNRKYQAMAFALNSNSNVSELRGSGVTLGVVSAFARTSEDSAVTVIAVTKPGSKGGMKK